MRKRSVRDMRNPFRRRQNTPCCEFEARYQRQSQHVWQARDAAAARAAAERADLIARVSQRYYLADALAKNGTSYQIAVADGLRHALAEIVGLNAISTGYRLDHGLSLTEEETCVVDVIDGRDIPVILRPETDVREPVTERLDRLHRAALRADNHPMFHYLYGKDGIKNRQPAQPALPL